MNRQIEQMFGVTLYWIMCYYCLTEFRRGILTERQIMAQVTITWKSFGNRPAQNRSISSVTIEVPNDFVEPQFHNMLLDDIYRNTNLYYGFYWTLIEPKLSATRTHTALSVGDEITIDGQTYVCADFGWSKIENADITYLPDGAILTVKEKAGA